MYLSRAPRDNVKAYDGSGDWFKIFQEGVCNSVGNFTTNAWCTWDMNWIAARVPKNTPNGEYLAHFEHIGELSCLSLTLFSYSHIRPNIVGRCSPLSR